MEGTFYCILVINKHTGKRGYIVDHPKEILIAESFVGDCVNFPTYQEAQQFIRDKKIERKGITAYIRDNQDIMKESGVALKSVKHDIYLITRGDNDYIHYSTNPQSYYFRKGQVGAAAWYDLESVQKAIESMRDNFIGETLIEEKIHSKN